MGSPPADDRLMSPSSPLSPGGSKKTTTAKEFGKALAMQKTTSVPLEGIDGSKYDFTSFRKQYAFEKTKNDMERERK